jgi:transcriptional/translational regulatory protein YebC/TACO1
MPYNTKKSSWNSQKHIENMEKMLDIFEDDDDVQNVWHNWEQD